MTSTKRFHISGDTVRNTDTGLLHPHQMTEAEVHHLIEALHSQREDPELLKVVVSGLGCGETLAGHNFGLIIRIADDI